MSNHVRWLLKGELIGQGRTADIFAWGDGLVLKLLKREFPASDLEYEARIARIIAATGFTVPAVGDLVKVEDRSGLIYERVQGPSMLQLLSAKPWKLFKVARQFAALHAAMHHHQQVELPSWQERIARSIQATSLLSGKIKQYLLEILDQMPKEEVICHGDFHPGNILMSPKGPVVIDWNNAVRGHPLADVARTSLILRSPILPPNTNIWQRAILKLFRRVFNYAYLRSYAHLRPYNAAQLKDWLPLVAAARLSENIAEEENYLLALIEKSLENLVSS